MLVDLPLAYFLPPNATTPGQLPMALDFEQTRCVALLLLLLLPVTVPGIATDPASCPWSRTLSRPGGWLAAPACNKYMPCGQQ